MKTPSVVLMRDVNTETWLTGVVVATVIIYQYVRKGKYPKFLLRTFANSL